MNHREYLRLITETPIAFDDETESRIGKTDLKTNTAWGKVPSPKATAKEIMVWVQWAEDNGILKKKSTINNSGASRIVAFNDDKTVFKYNNGSNDYSNQTAVENKIYKKFGEKYAHLLPKIYKFGTNWQVVEKIDTKWNPADFKSKVGVPYQAWQTFIGDISTNWFLPFFIEAGKSAKKTLILLQDKKVWDKYYQSGNYKFDDDEIKPLINCMKLLAVCPKMCEIMEMCIDSGIDWSDLHDGNFGFRGNDLIIIDWGYTNCYN